jgi:hypothetical protein
MWKDRWLTTGKVSFMAAVVIGLIAFGLPWAPIQKAHAVVFEGGNCRNVSWTNAGGVTASANICAAVNNHDFRHWNEAVWYGGTSNADVYSDYLKLYRGSFVQEQNNRDAWVQGSFLCLDGPAPVEGCSMESTDWEQLNCSQASGWYAVFRFKIRPYQNSGAGSPFFTVTSQTVTLPTC